MVQRRKVLTLRKQAKANSLQNRRIQKMRPNDPIMFLCRDYSQAICYKCSVCVCGGGGERFRSQETVVLAMMTSFFLSKTKKEAIVAVISSASTGRLRKRAIIRVCWGRGQVRRMRGPEQDAGRQMCLSVSSASPLIWDKSVVLCAYCHEIIF